MAYADFVTAMMALFMVLWISAQQKEILVATSKYFQNPFSSPLPASSGIMEGKREVPAKEENAERTRLFTPEMYMILAQEFLKLLDIPEHDANKPFELRVAPDSIQLILYNRNKQPVFEKGTAKLTEWGDYLSQNLAWVIDRFHMRVRVESYLATGAFAAGSGHDAWDLTAEQSNAIRHRLSHYGLEATMFDHVTGFGDTAPMKDLPAADESNNRVILSLTATPETPAPNLREGSHL